MTTEPEPDTVTTHLRPDGTVFPPVTPDPPAPPGYVDPLADAAALDQPVEGESTER